MKLVQNRQVTRLGTNKAVDVNIRLICATNVPLQELANENKFRKDLIYRINTVEITMPPLRKRISDVPLLARHFAKVYATKYLKPNVEFSQSALHKLQLYTYPGNIRELQYTIERAVIMAEDALLQPDDLIFSSLESTKPLSESDADNVPLSEMEKNAILRVIEKHSGNITRAAKELGLTRTALYRRLNKYDI
jgi:two-component system response regulator HydG